MGPKYSKHYKVFNRLQLITLHSLGTQKTTIYIVDDKYLLNGLNPD